MRFIQHGMHGVEFDKRLFFAQYDEAATGDDGTGTLQLRMQKVPNPAPVKLTGTNHVGRPANNQHVCTPAISPNGQHVVVTAEMPPSAPGVPGSVHANRHGGKGVYTDLWHLSPNGRRWVKLTSYAPLVNTAYFPDTPAGALIPQWDGDERLIWTEMIGYHPTLPLAVRRIAVADFVDRVGDPRIENLQTFTPGWAGGARFYEVWGIENGIALVCSDFGRASQAFPGLFLWEIGSNELVPLSAGNPQDWEEQAFFFDGRIYFMSTAGLGYQPIGGGGASFWESFRTELYVMDMDGSHRERVTFIHELDHPDYVPRVSGDTVRVFPFSKTRHGLYLDIVRNRGDQQLHGEAEIWHICL